MLHLETVETSTLSLLKELQKLPELKSFSLVGGTALSLKYGHRISVDLDLFGESNFDKEKVIMALRNKFSNNFIPEINRAKWAVFSYINGIKVDIVLYNHKLIAPLNTEDGIIMYSSEDIIAMKFNAILGRAKKKDFWDIYELLHYFSLSDMLEFHKRKFPDQMLLISIPMAITYFADADDSEDPISLKGQTWESVKAFISKKVSEYLK